MEWTNRGSEYKDKEPHFTLLSVQFRPLLQACYSNPMYREGHLPADWVELTLFQQFHCQPDSADADENQAVFA